MIDAYTDGLREPLRDGGYDVVHAQDCISANAALDAARRGRRSTRVRPHRPPRRRLPLAVADRLPGPLDRRPRPRARASRRRGSRALRDEFGVEAGLVRNGVDAERFRPPRDAGERAAARDAAGLGDAPRDPHRRRHRAAQGLADAARGLRRRPRGRCPSAAPSCWSPAARRCSTTATRSTASTRARASSDLDGSVRVLGPVDRRASSSASTAPPTSSPCPSTKEGFGLAVLEALAAGLPAVVSDLDVFRDLLADGDSALHGAGRRRRRARPTRSCARPRDPALARAAARRRARGGGAPRLGRRRRGARARPTRDFLARGGRR